MNRDCTLSATYSDGTWSMVIIGRGKEIKAMNTAPGTLPYRESSRSNRHSRFAFMTRRRVPDRLKMPAETVAAICATSNYKAFQFYQQFVIKILG